MPDSNAKSFFNTSTLVSSLLNNNIFFPLSSILLKRFNRIVDLPCPGLPPTIVISPLVRPPANLSIFSKPVFTSSLSVFLIDSMASPSASLISNVLSGLKEINSPICVWASTKTSKGVSHTSF